MGYTARGMGLLCGVILWSTSADAQTVFVAFGDCRDSSLQAAQRTFAEVGEQLADPTIISTEAAIERLGWKPVTHDIEKLTALAAQARELQSEGLIEEADRLSDQGLSAFEQMIPTERGFRSSPNSC